LPEGGNPLGASYSEKKNGYTWKDPRKQEAPKCEPKLAEANHKPFFGGLFIVETNNKLTTYATTKIVTN
jgi:hypothetical protein